MGLTIDDVRDQVRHHKWGRVFIEFKELLFILAGTFPYGFSVNQLLIPHAIVGGGLTGISEIVYFATDAFMPVWLTSLLLNCFLLLIAGLTVGWKFCIRTLYGVLCMSLWFKVIPIPAESLISDPFMAVVLGGLVCGVGLGLVFINNGATGGTDIVAMIVNKYKHLPMGRILLFCDFIIISCAYVLPEVRSVEKILFGLCFTFMSAMAVDWVMGRTRQSVQFFIFSQKYREIADAIMTRVPRGVTILDGEGGYSRQPMKVVTVLARSNESAKIFKIVKEIDPNAFVSQSQATGVFGQGFETIKD